MRRRRRKAKVVWLPNTGTLLGGNGAGLDASEQSAAIAFTQGLSFTQNSPTATVETPMVLDQDPDADQTGLTLAQRQLKGLTDEQTIGYRLRRIVGSFYCGVRATTAGAGSCPSAVLVQAGIIVRRVDPDTGLSIALGTGTKMLEPGNLENNADPWIWRKDWLLGPINNLLAAGTSTLLPAPDAGDQFSVFANCLPPINHAVTGVNGSPTVDQKTARRIGPEERLFLDVTASIFNDPTQAGQSVELMVVFPYRALATLGLNSGNRRNASR